MGKPKPAITVEGSKELARDLKKAGDTELLDELKVAHIGGAEMVLHAALPLVPVRSGALRDSLKATATARSGRVKAGKKSVPYAPPIHFGWPARNIAPNPFLYDALDARKGEVIEAYEKAVEKVAASVEGKRGLT